MAAAVLVAVPVAVPAVDGNSCFLKPNAVQRRGAGWLGVHIEAVIEAAAVAENKM